MLGLLEDTEGENYGSNNLLQEQLRLQQRKQRLIDSAKEAQKQAGILGQGQMVGDRYIKAPKMAAFLPIVQQLASHLEDRAIDEQTARLGNRITQAQQEHLDAFPGENADPKETLKWSMKGAQIPGMQPIMEAFVKDRLVAAPERAATRQSKADALAATLAEKKEQRERELEYRREADRIRSEDRRYQTDENNALRRELRGTVTASRGGGSRTPSAVLDDVAEQSGWKTVKNPAGKDIVSKENGDGTVTLIYKPTGEKLTIGDVGRPSAGVTKERIDQTEKRNNASKALEQLDEAERLLPQATGSLTGQLRDKVYGAAGIASTGAQSASQLDVLANNIVSGIPRMAGQVSDADLKFLQKQGGDLANRDLPVDARLAALKQVRRIMQKASSGQPEGQSPASSIREAVEAAAKQRGSKSIDDLLNKYK